MRLYNGSQSAGKHGFGFVDRCVHINLIPRLIAAELNRPQKEKIICTQWDCHNIFSPFFSIGIIVIYLL